MKLALLRSSYLRDHWAAIFEHLSVFFRRQNLDVPHWVRLRFYRRKNPQICTQSSSPTSLLNMNSLVIRQYFSVKTVKTRMIRAFHAAHSTFLNLTVCANMLRLRNALRTAWQGNLTRFSSKNIVELRLVTVFFIMVWAALGEASFLRVPFEGVRQTGMGNAFIAVADDRNVLFYNPAGLARIKELHFDMFDATLGVDNNDTLQRVKSALLKGTWESLLRPDRPQFMRFATNPTFLAPYFGLGLFENFQSFMEISDSPVPGFPGITVPQIDVFGANDVGVVTGVGIPMGDFIAVGASFRLLHRSAIDTTINFLDLLSQIGLTQQDFYSAVYSQLSKSAGIGYGLGATLGTLFRIPLLVKTTQLKIAATIEDIGRTTFKPIGQAPVPPPIPMKATIGVAVKYSLIKGNEFNLAFDVRELAGAQPLCKMLHLGAEFMNRFFAFRAGISEGYPTFGFTFRAFPHTRIHFSSFSKELGDDWFQKEMRLYLIQAVIGFNLL